MVSYIFQIIIITIIIIKKLKSSSSSSSSSIGNNNSKLIIISIVFHAIRFGGKKTKKQLFLTIKIIIKLKLVVY